MNQWSTMIFALLLVLVPLGNSFATTRAHQGGAPVTFGTLLDQMSDMARLARMPDVFYKTIQFSSYDRRSVSPEAEGWFSNADGFGSEPIPGFSEVLERPGEDGLGLYLVAQVNGPGAIVRGWSAGMGGELRVYLDDAEKPLFDGSAYDFLAKRSEIFLAQAGLAVDCGDAFRQQDADYLPVPFSKSLRVTWKGRLNELHFYHLEVRIYPEEIPVKTFDVEGDLTAYEANLRDAVQRLTRPAPSLPGEKIEMEAELKPHEPWEWTTPPGGSGAIAEFSLRMRSPDLWKALRGTLLEIAFDGADRPQVEAPAGDFFGSGPGVNPFGSLPFSVGTDGKMTCRFVMPFRERAVVTLLNTTQSSIHMTCTVTLSPWKWDDSSLYFRAKWRADNDLDLRRREVIDMPYLLVRGQGRFVGAAVMVVNPSATPTPGGNWWGEGDEKIFVDDEPFPSFFGTGSEDYFNYSWSRPDLFDHPYCGQPLDSGPGTLGYVSNHRWHILDEVPFQRFFAFYLELWPHNPFPGLCYSRIAYHYARGGAIDDHRALRPKELTVPALHSNEPQPIGGASNSTFHHFGDRVESAGRGTVVCDGVQPGASRGILAAWNAQKGDRLSKVLPVDRDSEVALNLVAAHWPESGSLRLLLEGKPLVVEDLGGAGEGEKGEETVVLKSGYSRRLLSTRFRPMNLRAGDHELILECTEGGRFGLDYIWIQYSRKRPLSREN